MYDQRIDREVNGFGRSVGYRTGDEEREGDDALDVVEIVGRVVVSVVGLGELLEMGDERRASESYRRSHPELGWESWERRGEVVGGCRVEGRYSNGTESALC